MSRTFEASLKFRITVEDMGSHWEARGEDAFGHPIQCVGGDEAQAIIAIIIEHLRMEADALEYRHPGLAAH